ncbi:MAG: RNB domain-containing ribonuclease [Thermoleophilaceae bacterium]|nr:RNB domain-containing ribonuclease [Thermoleophilaceae bacterium]
MRTGTRAHGRAPVLEPVVAVLARRGRLTVAEPLFDAGRRITLPPRALGGAHAGQIVLVGGGKRGARVVRVLGRPDVARDVLEALMLDRGLRRSFPRAVALEAEERASGIGPWREPGASRGRRDLTDLPTFTIDPLHAKDFDDAISARREQGGRVRVWVHIADVSAYVEPSGATEGEAYRRGTSVYVPGAVEPMLPEALSNRACSLVPGEPRLAVTVEMEMDGADPVSVAFYRSIVRSDARLTYERVDRIFAGEERAEEPWAGPLEAAREVASALRDRRGHVGALEVDAREPVFEFDDGGDVVGVVHEEQTESHELIEHLMILANERVASYLHERGVPTLYRVHERPAPQSIQALAEKLESLEVPTPPLPDPMSPQQASDAAGEMSRLVARHVRRTGRGRQALTALVLRSLKQAYYSPVNIGHAGLASACYCHFTSPIRRYPDLVVHRGLLASLGWEEHAPRAEDMEEAGLASSAAERHAMDIERAAQDVCLAFLLERELSERGRETVFEGEVVGLIGAGAFVSFGEAGFEGFLPVRRLRGDWWDLNEEGTALIGARSGSTLRLGDPLRVVVERVDTARGRVDLSAAASE